MKLKKPFDCSLCEYKCSHKANLSKHIAAVHEAKNTEFSCSVCDYTCSQKEHLKTHVSLVHNDKKGKQTYNCTITNCIKWRDFYTM